MSSSPENFDPYWHWLGIEPAARPVNHYSLLGLPLFETDLTRIAAAADERMRHVRQFQTGPRGSHTQKLLNELARAKICLLNSVSKPAYDQALHQVLYPPPRAPSPTAAPPKPKRKLEDIMPPGWDGSLLLAQPPLPMPHETAPAREKAVSDALSEQGRQRKTQPIAMFAAIGALVLVIGVLSTLLILSLRFEEVPGDNTIRMPKQPARPVPAVPDQVDEPTPEAVIVLQEGSGELNLTPATALVEGDLVREVIDTSEALVNWSSPQDAAEWQFKLVKPGFFKVELQYQSHPSLTGKLVKIGWDGETKSVPLRPPVGEMPTVRDSHIVLIKRGGTHTFTFRPGEPLPAKAFQLMSIRLIPAVGP